MVDSRTNVLTQRVGNTSGLAHVFSNAHKGPVTCVVIFPNNKCFATGSQDNTIKIWDLRTRSLLGHILKAHLNWIFALAVTSDCRVLVSCSSDNTIKMWDAETKAMIHHFQNAHAETIMAISISFNDKYIVSGSCDTTVKLWDIKRKRLAQHFQGAHEHWVSAVICHPLDKFAFTASNDRSIKCWDMDNKIFVWDRKDAHQEPINALTISSSGKMLASGASDGTMRVWNLESRKIAYKFEPAHHNSIYSLDFSENNRFIVSSSPDCSIKLFDLESKSEIYSFDHCHDAPVTGVRFSPNNKFIVSVSRDNSIKLWRNPTDYDNIVRNFIESCGEELDRAKSLDRRIIHVLDMMKNYHQTVEEELNLKRSYNETKLPDLKQAKTSVSKTMEEVLQKEESMLDDFNFILRIEQGSFTSQGEIKKYFETLDLTKEYPDLHFNMNDSSEVIKKSIEENSVIMKRVMESHCEKVLDKLQALGEEEDTSAKIKIWKSIFDMHSLHYDDFAKTVKLTSSCHDLWKSIVKTEEINELLTHIQQKRSEYLEDIEERSANYPKISELMRQHHEMSQKLVQMNEALRRIIKQKKELQIELESNEELQDDYLDIGHTKALENMQEIQAQIDKLSEKIEAMKEDKAVYVDKYKIIRQNLQLEDVQEQLNLFKNTYDFICMIKEYELDLIDQLLVFQDGEFIKLDELKRKVLQEQVQRYRSQLQEINEDNTG